MNVRELANELQADMAVLNALLASVREEQMRWKPDADRWSLLEVLNHLLDEERADFRQALMNLIENPKIGWPDISPAEWVESRSYNAKDPAQIMKTFLSERERSLQWLSGQSSLDVETVHEGTHPLHRPMKAGDIMASWIAHDYFHIRQITNLKWEYLAHSSKPYECWYAGEY